MPGEITVGIPTIAPRAAMLARAVKSVAVQTLRAASILVEYDHNRTGSAATRNRILDKVTTEWVAWLDDDDEMMPHHLETLLHVASNTSSDVVYSLPRVLDGNGNLVPRHFDWNGGPVFDPQYLQRKGHIQTTCLVRAAWAKKVGGFQWHTDETGAVNDDHGFFLALCNAGAVFHHLHEETFIWHHHGYGQPGVAGNTSGKPDRW